MACRTIRCLPALTWEWTGDQEEQAESGAFLVKAFAGALGLMFIILLAQFNSFYNAVLVLMAVVMSTAGVLVGMLVMDQAFSIIMTGTGIVALAGIVVNNNIILIDTYQDYSQYMPRTRGNYAHRRRPDPARSVDHDHNDGRARADDVRALAGLFRRRLFDRQPDGAVVEATGHGCCLRAGHRDRFDAGLHAVHAGAAGLDVDLCGLVRAAAGETVAGRGSRAAQDWALRKQAKKLTATQIIWTQDDFTAQAPSLKTVQAAE